MAQDGGIHGPVRPCSSEICWPIMETTGGNRSKGCKSSIERESPLTHCCPARPLSPLTLRSRWWPSSLLGLPCFALIPQLRASRQRIRSLLAFVSKHAHTASLILYLITTYTISLRVWPRILSMHLYCVRSMIRAQLTSTLPLDYQIH